MSELSLAYIFHEQQLLVDENFQLPEVEKLEDDLDFIRAIRSLPVIFLI